MRTPRRVLPLLLLALPPLLSASAGITLSSFTGSGSVNGVRLDWTTSSETNNFGFYVQRSLNAQTDYQTVPGSFVPGAGTTIVPQTYTYTDAAAGAGTWYYRLQQVDLDGPTHYTAGILVHRPVYCQYLADSTSLLLLHLDETTGTVAHDVSSYRTHGAVAGTAFAAGRFGPSRAFAGASDHITVPDTPSLRPAALTVEAWVLAPAFTAMNSAVIATKRRTTGPASWTLRLAGTSGRAWFGTALSEADSVVSRAPLADGLWHHLAGVHEGGTLRLYVDGVLEESRTPPGAIPYDGGGVFVGRDSGGAAGWTGSIDEIRLSSGARVPAEFNLQLPPAGLTASVVGGTVQLSWVNGGGGVGLLRYRVYRGTDSTTVALLDSAAGTSYTDAQPPGASLVYYRVTAVDSTGFEGRPGAAAGVLTPPAPPVLSAPPDGASGLALPITLRWHPSPGANTYRIQVAADPTFGVILLDDSTLTDTAFVLSSPPLAARYYWRVSARGTAGTGAPSASRSFTRTITVQISLEPGWNMISLPVIALEDSLLELFPTSLFPYAFVFVPSQGYVSRYRLTPGEGYWAKFGAAHVQAVIGLPITRDSISVEPGWNMIGSLSAPVDTAAIVSVPPGNVTSSYFGFDGSYDPAAQLMPGKAYWVKVAAQGVLVPSVEPRSSRRDRPAR